MSMRRALFRSLLVMTASLSVAGAASLSATAAPTTKAQFGPTATVIAVGAAVQVRGSLHVPVDGQVSCCLSNCHRAGSWRNGARQRVGALEHRDV